MGNKIRRHSNNPSLQHVYRGLTIPKLVTVSSRPPASSENSFNTLQYLAHADAGMAAQMHDPLHARDDHRLTEPNMAKLQEQLHELQKTHAWEFFKAYQYLFPYRVRGTGHDRMVESGHFYPKYFEFLTFKRIETWVQKVPETSEARRKMGFKKGVSLPEAFVEHEYMQMGNSMLLPDLACTDVAQEH